MNYTWKISKLGLTDKLGTDDVLLENAIVNIKWKRIATDADGIKTSYVGNTSLDAEMASSDFIALNDVTAENVTSWLEAALTVAGVENVDRKLVAKVERKRLRNISPSW